MPTSIEEATKIVSIIDDYVDVKTARLIVDRLHNEVGQKTDNSSLKVSLEMLRDLYSHEKLPMLRARLTLAKKAIIFVAAFHLLVLAGNCLSILLFPFVAPWWATLLFMPMFLYFVNLLYSKFPCVLTTIENKLRQIAGRPEIDGFIKHYILPRLR